MKRLALLSLLAPTPVIAHPHIFVDVGLEVRITEEGTLQGVKVTWAYDALYSLLITEDYGLDADGDAMLTSEEEAKLTGFDMRWVEGFNGDLVAILDGKALALSGPGDATAVMREGRIVTTHLRKVEEMPQISGKTLTFKPFDPTYYTAYDVRLAVTIEGMDGCMIDRQEPDLDREMERLQAELSRVGQDQSTLEMGFPEVGEAFATTIKISCAGF